MRLRDVLIVGGGPAGSASALELARGGHDVLLIDEAEFPRDKVCGESLSPGAGPLLDRLGVRDAVLALAPQPIQGMRLTSPDGTTFRGDYPGTARGLAIRRTVLDDTLLRCARAVGVEVWTGTRAHGLLLDGARVVGVRARRPNGDDVELRARIVLACDGRRSLVARRLGLLREDPRLRRFAVRGYWNGMAGLEARGEMHVGRGSYCGVAPLGEGRANVTLVVDARDMAQAAGDLPGFYRRTLRRWPELTERLGEARECGRPRAIGPLAVVARRVWHPGAMLVGDSAGFLDPFTGEGMTLALHSAVLAAEAARSTLARAGSSAPLRDYARRRAHATRHKFRFNRLLQAAVGWPSLADALAHRLSRRPDLADRLVAVAGDLVAARDALSASLVWELLRA